MSSGGHNRRAVLKMDTDGNIVARYASATEAARANYWTVQTICNHCNGYHNKGVLANRVAPDGYIYQWEGNMKKIIGQAIGLVIGLLICVAGAPIICLAEEPVVVIESETSTKPDTVRVYTQEDLDILAHVICGEAQCYSDEEQLYVGSVVLNRVADSRYPNTIRGVVFQRGQYACTRDGNYYREPTAANWYNARYLLENGPILPANVVYQSGRRQGRGVYVRTKYHYYCY